MKKIFWLPIICISILNNFVFASQQDEEYTQSEKNNLFESKLANTEELSSMATGYYDPRLITFGTHFFIRDEDHYKLHAQRSDTTKARLYKKDFYKNKRLTKSQLIITNKDISLGASVDTSIRTTTIRKNEKKGTFVQYDKNHVIRKNKDFCVDARNNKKEVNYDGGHLVDHKFSAQGSHTDEFNYVPQHHAYNRWLKESIVKDVEGYVEIPFYTPNPPLIKVLGQERYDPIPIGLLLISLKNKNILDAYYFPNNQYDYRVLQGILKLKSLSGKKITPYFKLKEDLYPLLGPAIIYDSRKNNVLLTTQRDTEDCRVDIVDDLIQGMSVLDFDEEEVLPTLASNVLYQENVNLLNILDLQKSKLNQLNKGQPNSKALNQSFNVLGQFLMNYAMKNALKSEVLAPTSRIMFLNIIADFADYYHQFEGKSLKALNYMLNTYEKDFEKSLTELYSKKETFNLRDMLYFANFYQKLSTETMHNAFCDGYELGEEFSCVENNLKKFIEILQNLYIKTEHKKLTLDQMQDLVNLFSKAQENFSFIIRLGFPKEYLMEEKQFLKRAKNKIQSWNQCSETQSGSYQTSPNSMTSFRGINGLNVPSLGTYSSGLYPNSESEQSSEEEEDL